MRKIHKSRTKNCIQQYDEALINFAKNILSGFKPTCFSHGQPLLKESQYYTKFISKFKEIKHFADIIIYYFIAAIADVYKNEGNDEYNKKNFSSAINYYTEGIKVNCKDKELKAKLYSNRAAALFNLGKKMLLVVLNILLRLFKRWFCSRRWFNARQVSYRRHHMVMFTSTVFAILMCNASGWHININNVSIEY